MNLKTFNIKEFLLFGVPLAIIDLFIYVAVYEWLLSVYTFTVPEDLTLKSPRCLYLLVLGYLIAVSLVHSWPYDRGYSWKKQFVTILFQSLLAIGVLAVSVNVLFYSFAGFFYLYEGILTVLLLNLCHLLFRAAILFARKRGRNKIHVVIVGTDDNAQRLAGTFGNEEEFGDYKVVASFAGDLDEIRSYLESNKVHQLYCSLDPSRQPETVSNLIRLCENLYIAFYYIPDLSGYFRPSLSIQEIGSVPVLNLREEPLSIPANAAVKRCLDILFSLLFLLFLFPFIWMFVAVMTRITSPGPVFFKQTRTGYKGKPFTLYKFRSMKENAAADSIQATSDDPRKTKFGDFLRRSSIDELPQFINVLKGDMSIIGPRPHMELHTEMYSKLIDEYPVRHMVKPGITGWAQINGCRGETPTPDYMRRRVIHDIWYIEHWSLSLDFRIFFKTISQVLRGDKQAY